MSDEIELISDGDGLAVFGEQGAVERFLAAIGVSRDTPTRALAVAASVVQTGAAAVAESGRWVKLTAESAAKVKQFGLTPTKTAGVSHAMIGKPGAIKNWIQIEDGVATMLTNPAVLANAAALMTQMAMQQQIEAIAEYLEVIDRKIDSVLRTQVNQVLSRLDGVELAIREGFAIREAVGRVSEITWSKLQTAAQTIHEVQGFSIRQLGELVESIDAKKIHELLELVNKAEHDVKKWLFVLARCFELLDQVGIIELDRVLDASPDELDRHRLGIQSARSDRMSIIRDATERVLARIGAAIVAANSRVLFNPIQSPAVVTSGENIRADVFDLRALLGIEGLQGIVTARRWREAANDGLETIRGVAGRGVETSRKSGGAAISAVKDAKGRVAGRISERRERTEDTDDAVG